MTTIDLTPFGFTPTENLAYGALLRIGPSSGYAVAKELGIARANAYQALNGLVGKGAAVSVDEQPARYRALRSDALLARVIELEASKLDALEEQVAESGEHKGQATIPISGVRGLVDIAMRTVARSPDALTCIATSELISQLGPAWRRRAGEEKSTAVWLLGPDPGGLAVEPEGSVNESECDKMFGSPVFVLVTADRAIVARVEKDTAAGYWTSDLTMMGAIRGLVRSLTGMGL